MEPPEGQYAIALVTINRSEQRHKPICRIVFEPKQFSWTIGALDKKGKLKPEFHPTGILWNKALLVARTVDSSVDFTLGATYFYADYIVPPNWAKEKELVGHWGHHYFLREKSHEGIINN